MSNCHRPQHLALQRPQEVMYKSTLSICCQGLAELTGSKEHQFRGIKKESRCKILGITLKAKKEAVDGV